MKCPLDSRLEPPTYDAAARRPMSVAINKRASDYEMFTLSLASTDVFYVQSSNKTDSQQRERDARGRK